MTKIKFEANTNTNGVKIFGIYGELRVIPGINEWSAKAIETHGLHKKDVQESHGIVVTRWIDNLPEELCAEAYLGKAVEKAKDILDVAENADLPADHPLRKMAAEKEQTELNALVSSTRLPSLKIELATKAIAGYKDVQKLGLIYQELRVRKKDLHIAKLVKERILQLDPENVLSQE